MTSLGELERRFDDAWPRALVAFSPYTRLLAPIYCRTRGDERREKLEGSFAMIRLRDERIVISLRQIADLGLGEHAQAILAHEVGHYVHAPGNIEEHVRLYERVRRTLPIDLRPHTALVSNLYTDLLLNDRLQRSGAANIAAVYAALRDPKAGALWTLYTRIYERLWRLARGTLGPEPSPEIDGDADLGARIVRVFRERWLDGAGSFTRLLESYLANLPKDERVAPPWLDTVGTSVGDRVPDGLTEEDDDEGEDVPHPACDRRLTGEDGDAEEEQEGEQADERAERRVHGRALRGDGRPDRRKVVRGPREWIDLLRAVGVQRSDNELVARYYRELAMPHVIPFPAQRIERAGEPLPEALDAWEPGSPLESIEWFETLARSSVLIPGVTTLERTWGVTEGGEPERRPPDLYVGIDCSGSMGNPAFQIAYPVVAGVVLALSALRAGARVMACLSGQWLGDGRFVQTPDFVRDEAKILGVLTDYLGTGASFGLDCLARAFPKATTPRGRPAHVLVVSDSDLFGEIEGTKDGWEIARSAIESAGAGATAVLRLADPSGYPEWLSKMKLAGFETHCVASEEELVAFARAFSRRTFAFELPGGARA